MVISISLALVLVVAVWILHRFFGLRLWHAAVCMVLGMYLGSTRAGSIARDVVTALATTLAGLVQNLAAVIQ